MASNQGRVSRPYRKASEYLHSAQKQSMPGEAQVRVGSYVQATSGVDQVMQHISKQTRQLQRNSESQNQAQTELMLTRKLERAEAEYAQSREYWENQLDLSHDRELKISEQYKRLQSSYAALQATNKELEDRVSKVINRLEAERDAMVREINELTNKVTETRNSLLKSQEENERLRKDCNIAVQLLKCNQSSYQVQRTEQLPDNIQERVNSYKVELQDYNEYINPYAEGESDSESDGGTTQNKPTNSKAGSSDFQQQRTQQNSHNIPIEYLAQALKKPENVHMNLEASDYVQDPSLHSVYKAQYLDKKLIKPDYPQEKRDADLPRYRAPPALSNTNQSVTSRAPVYSKQPVKESVASEESSPWQLAPSRTGLSNCEEIDDGSSAGAYGAYSVGPKRRVPRRYVETYSQPTENRHIELSKTSIPKPQPKYEKPNFDEAYQKRSESFSAAVRPASPDNLEFRSSTIQPPAHSGVSSYFSRSAKSSPSITSSSNNSSKKSTPLKVRGKEMATTAETSSLLHQSASDEEDLQLEASQHSSKQSSPDKGYLKKEKTNTEESGSLLQPEDDEVDSIPPECGEIDLEWEVEIPTENITEILEENNSEIVQEEDNEPKAQPFKPEPDLLLSYKPIESPAKSSIADLEDLVLSTPEHMRFSSDDGMSLLENQQHLPPPNPNGQLLSEIVTNNPSLSNFLMAQPPPPPQFSSSNEASMVTPSVRPYDSSIHLLCSNTQTPPEKSPMISPQINQPSENIPNSNPVRVDEQVEVIDLDEEPRKRVNRRRNSFDQAQEFGNILNL